MTDIEIEDEGTRASRGVSSVMGKCIFDTKVWLPKEIDEALTEAAYEDGANKSEYIRDMLCLKFKGKTWGELQAESRRASILGTGPNAALNLPVVEQGGVGA